MKRQLAQREEGALEAAGQGQPVAIRAASRGLRLSPPSPSKLAQRRQSQPARSPCGPGRDHARPLPPSVHRSPPPSDLKTFLSCCQPVTSRLCHPTPPPGVPRHSAQPRGAFYIKVLLFAFFLFFLSPTPIFFPLNGVKSKQAPWEKSRGHMCCTCRSPATLAPHAHMYCGRPCAQGPCPVRLRRGGRWPSSRAGGPWDTRVPRPPSQPSQCSQGWTDLAPPFAPKGTLASWVWAAGVNSQPHGHPPHHPSLTTLTLNCS